MIQKQTTETPIEEIHRIRREISDRFGGDVAAIAEDASRRLEASGRPIWRPSNLEKVELKTEGANPVQPEALRKDHDMSHST